MLTIDLLPIHRRADDLLAVEVLWTPEEEVRGGCEQWVFSASTFSSHVESDCAALRPEGEARGSGKVARTVQSVAVSSLPLAASKQRFAL